MDEVNHSITTMTAAGKGNATPFSLTEHTKAIIHISRTASHPLFLVFYTAFTSSLRYGWIKNAQYAN